MTRTNPNKFDQIFDQIAGDLNRHVIGFDRIFDGFCSMAGAYDSYPPYNLEQLRKDK